MDAEGGGRRKNLPRAGGSEPIAQNLAEPDAKKLDSQLRRGKVVGIRIAYKR